MKLKFWLINRLLFLVFGALIFNCASTNPPVVILMADAVEIPIDNGNKELFKEIESELINKGYKLEHLTPKLYEDSSRYILIYGINFEKYPNSRGGGAKFEISKKESKVINKIFEE